MNNESPLKTKNTGIIDQNRVFVWLAVGAVFLLLIPFLLMTSQIPLLDPGSGMEVINWSIFDFIVMGILILITGSVFVLIARKFKTRPQRVLIAILLMLAFLWICAELAVGIFTNWGN